jgi:hypothetical protein
MRQARAGGCRAPLLLLVQGAPPLPQVLRQLCAPPAPPLLEVVLVLGDDRGISEDEIALVERAGAAAAGGGPVLCASLGAGCLLASQCVVVAQHYLDAIHDCPSQLWPQSTEVRRAGRQRHRQQQRRGGRRTQGSAQGVVLDSSEEGSSGGDDVEYSTSSP